MHHRGRDTLAPRHLMTRPSMVFGVHRCFQLSRQEANPDHWFDMSSSEGHFRVSRHFLTAWARMMFAQLFQVLAQTETSPKSSLTRFK